MLPAQPKTAYVATDTSLLHQEPELVQRFLRLAIVNILSNLTVPLAGLVSVAFLGHLVELHYLAGVTLATVLFNYLYRTLGFLRMSTTGVTAQAVGRNDRIEVLLIGVRNSLLAIGLGLLVLLLQHPIREFSFTLLSADPAIKAAAQLYYDARVWAAPATLLNFVIIGWLLGREKSGQVLLISTIGNGLNILLDYFLIVRLGWNSAGAGWAIVISQYVMALLGLGLIGREVSWQELQAIVPKIWDQAALKQTVSLNSNIFIRTLAFLSTFSVFTTLSSAMGELQLAENALLLQVFSLAVYLIDGLAFATESLTGILHGQNNAKPLRFLIKISSGTSLGFGLLFALPFVLFPMPLFTLLTNHDEVLSTIGHSVTWLIPVLGFGSLAFMLDGYFLGLAEGATLRNVALIASIGGFTPIAVLAWQTQSNDFLWLSLAVFMAIRVILLGIQLPRTLNED